MKRNMKQAALGLCMAACLFSLSACSNANSASDEIDAEVRLMLEQAAPDFLDRFVQMQDDAVLDEYKKQASKQPGGEAMADGVDSWKSVKDDLGQLISVSDNVEIEEISGGYSATIHAVFEKREMDFTITTDEGPDYVTGISFVPEYSLGENMEQAFFNMMIGMGTVFAVLIFISLLIGCFKYINQAEEKSKQKREAKQPEPLTPAQPQVLAAAEAVEEEELADDLELVAVITAAIAASTGSNPSGLVVRSIKRAPAAKWKKA